MSLDVHLTINDEDVYSANITHNLIKMADEAGLYSILWGPEEMNLTKAYQLVEPLRLGLKILKSEPERFMKLNASNGWGKYENFVPFVEKYLEACLEYLNADISVSR